MGTGGLEYFFSNGSLPCFLTYFGIIPGEGGGIRVFIVQGSGFSGGGGGGRPDSYMV